MISIDYKTLEEALSKSTRKCYRPIKVSECDGGSGAAGASGGDVGGSAGAGADVGEGTTSTDVLGKCDHTHGEYLGAGCFHIPAKCQVPFHRWEIGNGGSKRKKDKNGRDKRYAYEKGMKVVYDMLHEDEASKVKIPKNLMKSRLKRIARAIRTMNDAKIAERKFEDEGPAKASKIPAKFNKAKEAFLDIGAFLKDICKRNYKASWFTISLLVVAIVYVLSPVDLIPDPIPGLGQIDDAMVIMWVFNALKDEFEQWRAWKSQINIKEELDLALNAQNKKMPLAEMAKQLEERKMTRVELNDFYSKLEAGEVEFDFIKKDGSRRHARGTLNPDLMPSREEMKRIYQEQNVDLDSLEARLQERKDYMPYFWDLENNGYRQFHVSRFEGLSTDQTI